MGQTSRRGIVGLFLLLLVFFILFMLFATYTMKNLSSSVDDETGRLFKRGSKPIAVVEIEGVIMNSKETIEKLNIAEKDDAVKAIILRIDSPGGAVGPTQEIYEEVRKIIKEGKQKVYASFGSVAASGGYYVGAAAEKIYSNAGTVTGSIGVIMHFMDMSKLYEFAKVKPVIVKGGKYKDVGSPHREMSTEEKSLMANMIAGVHDQFRRDILSTRKDRIVGDINDHTQGQIFSGEQAMKLGLVDELAGLWEAGRRIHKELKIEEDFGLKFIKLKKPFKFGDFLENIEGKLSSFNNAFLNKIPMLIYSP